MKRMAREEKAESVGGWIDAEVRRGFPIDK
jgi:hypothetical protein